MIRSFLPLILLLAFGCSRSATEKTGTAPARADAHGEEVTLTPEAAAALEVETVQRRPLPSLLTVPARIDLDPAAIARVGSPLSGTVVALHARVGDHVASGAPLLTIRSVEFAQIQSELVQNTLIARNAAPLAALARASWERARELQQKTEGVSLNEVQRREAEYLSALRQETEASSAAEQARQRLAVYGFGEDRLRALESTGVTDPLLTLTAPIEGELVERRATLGERVAPDSHDLATLARTRMLRIVADVPEASVGALSIGVEANVAVARGNGELSVSGRVTHLGTMIDPRTRTFPARVEADQLPPGFHAGMFARVDLTIGTSEPELVIPASAVQQMDGRPIVFVPVADEAGTFQVRSIEIGSPVGESVAVTRGLQAGERVVTRGSFVLKAEMSKDAAGHDH